MRIFGSVQYDGMLLRYIKPEKQTKQICMTALQQNNEAQEYIKIPL